MATNVLQAYKSARVNTASQGDLLLMLYDAAIRNTKGAVLALQSNDYRRAHTHLVKAQEIVEELMASLNLDFEISRGLYRLYEYCMHCLVQANLGKAAGPAENALRIFSELREAWRQIAKADPSNSQANSQAGRSMRPAVDRTSPNARGGIEFAH